MGFPKEVGIKKVRSEMSEMEIHIGPRAITLQEFNLFIIKEVPIWWALMRSLLFNSLLFWCDRWAFISFQRVVSRWSLVDIQSPLTLHFYELLRNHRNWIPIKLMGH